MESFPGCESVVWSHPPCFCFLKFSIFGIHARRKALGVFVESTTTNFRQPRSKPATGTAVRRTVNETNRRSLIISSESIAKVPVMKCVCGRHHTGLCWAICEDQRPNGYQLSETTQKRLEEAIERDPSLRKLRDEHRRRPSTARADVSSEIASDNERYRSMIEEACRDNIRDNVVLGRDSVLLNTTASRHIVNNRGRFTTYVPYPETERPRLPIVGNQAPEIHGVGQAGMWVLTPERRKSQDGSEECFACS